MFSALIQSGPTAAAHFPALFQATSVRSVLGSCCVRLSHIQSERRMEGTPEQTRCGPCGAEQRLVTGPISHSGAATVTVARFCAVQGGCGIASAFHREWRTVGNAGTDGFWRPWLLVSALLEHSMVIPGLNRAAGCHLRRGHGQTSAGRGVLLFSVRGNFSSVLNWRSSP